jgi:hypothetical protein
MYFSLIETTHTRPIECFINERNEETAVCFSYFTYSNSSVDYSLVIGSLDNSGRLLCRLILVSGEANNGY